MITVCSVEQSIRLFQKEELGLFVMSLHDYETAMRMWIEPVYSCN